MEVDSIFSKSNGYTPKNHLYLICDGEMCATRGISLVDFVAGATAARASIMQYRHKNISVAEYESHLKTLLPFCREASTMLIVNDHAGIAEKFSLPVHLGQGDVLPPGLQVPYGRSTHSRVELNFALQANPLPSYIALGTMFESGTKPDVKTNRNLVNDYIGLTELPLVLIGGITLDNVQILPRSERIFYAVIGDAFRYGATKQGIEKYVKFWGDI